MTVKPKKHKPNPRKKKQTIELMSCGHPYEAGVAKSLDVDFCYRCAYAESDETDYELTKKLPADTTKFGTLHFKLPEEQEAFDRAAHADDIATALWELGRYLRDQLKYNNDLTDVQQETLEEVQKQYYELCMDLPEGVTY